MMMDDVEKQAIVDWAKGTDKRVEVAKLSERERCVAVIEEMRASRKVYGFPDGAVLTAAIAAIRRIEK